VLALTVFLFDALLKDIAERHIIIYGSDCSVNQSFAVSVALVDGKPYSNAMQRISSRVLRPFPSRNGWIMFSSAIVCDRF